MTVMATVAEPNTVASALAAWPNVLRSGEYKQGHGQMKFNDEYCCIGVLDELAFGADWTESDEEGVYVDQFGNLAMLDAERVAQCNLDKAMTLEECGTLHSMLGDDITLANLGAGSGRQITLTSLNDRGATFEQIADFVEAVGWNELESE